MLLSGHEICFGTFSGIVSKNQHLCELGTAYNVAKLLYVQLLHLENS